MRTLPVFYTAAVLTCFLLLCGYEMDIRKGVGTFFRAQNVAYGETFSHPFLAQAEISDVQQLVEAMEKAYAHVVDYTLIGYVKLEKDYIVVDYRSVRPSSVRTEVLLGKLKGKMALYVPERKKDSVKVKAGIFRLWYSIKKLKIENTPLVESLLDTLLRSMKTGEVSFKGKVRLVSHLGGSLAFTPTLTESAETASPSPQSVAPSPAPSNRNDKGGVATSPWLEPRTVDRLCYLVEIKSDTFVDMVAIDEKNFCLVYAKRTKQDNSSVFEALFVDMKINTAPKMEL
jgi:hypothetical protein